jgi:hypothetical protein
MGRLLEQPSVARGRGQDRQLLRHFRPRDAAASLHTSHGPVGSVSQPLPVEPRDGPHKKSGPGIAPEARPYRRGVHPPAAINIYIATPAFAVKL